METKTKKPDIFSDNKKLIDRIKERETILKASSVELKKHFVGIDEQIDKICDSIRTWWYMPELMTRPCIVCLFGATGVGKTDLVRRLVKLLNYQDKYCEIELSNKSSTWARSVGSLMRQNPGVKSGEPSILLLDEIQGFRTIDEQGNDILDYDMKDIWTLLSDGKLPYKAEIESLMNMLWDYNKKDLMKKVIPNKKVKKETSSGSSPYPSPYPSSGKVITTVAYQIPDKMNRKQRISSEDIKAMARKLAEDDVLIPSEEEDDKIHNQFNYYNLNYFKTLLRLTEPIEEIATWSDEKKKSVIMQRMVDKTIFDEEDFTKTLIFISGNIDEAYHFTKNAREVDVDADILHEKSKKISILDIKGALGERFRPEQISRMGNTHIVYPTLSKKSFEKIIERKIVSIINRVKEQTGIEIEVAKSINKLIYDNGVFPTQGTRPLFSTLSEILETSLPEFLMNALIKKEKNIKLSYEKGYMVARFGNKIQRVKYVGSLDKLKIQHGLNIDRKTWSSVHESGHAIIHGLLFKVSPSQIVSTPISEQMEGFIAIGETCSARSVLSNRVCELLGGQEAEKLVFGEDSMTSANHDDLAKATMLTTQMIRRWGMASFVAATGHSEKTPDFNNDTEKTNPLIESMMIEESKRARKLIMENKNMFLEVVDGLMKEDKIEPPEFVKICRKHGLNINKYAKADSISYSDFRNKLSEFRKEKK